jgi:hypothetical protein
MTEGEQKAVRRAVNFARNLQHEYLIKVVEEARSMHGQKGHGKHTCIDAVP